MLTHHQHPQDLDWHSIARSTGYTSTKSARTRFTEVKARFVEEHRSGFRGNVASSATRGVKRDAEASAELEVVGPGAWETSSMGIRKIPSRAGGGGKDGDDVVVAGKFAGHGGNALENIDAKSRADAALPTAGRATIPAKKRRTQGPEASDKRTTSKRSFGLIDLTASTASAASTETRPANHHQTPQYSVRHEARLETRRDKKSPNDSSKPGHGKRTVTTPQQSNPSGQHNDRVHLRVEQKPRVPAKADSSDPFVEKSRAGRDCSVESWEDLA